MKHELIITFTALLCITAVVVIWTIGEADADGYETFDDITVSCVHSDTLLVTLPTDEIAETVTEKHTEESTEVETETETQTETTELDLWDMGLEWYGISYEDTNRSLRLITYEGYGYSPLSYYVACCCWVRATEGYWGYLNLYQAFGEADTSYDTWMDGLGIADFAYVALEQCYRDPMYVRYCNGMAVPYDYIYYQDGIYVWN